MSNEHCIDCCCARSWKALGISEYTGKSIPEHICEMKGELVKALRGLMPENWDDPDGHMDHMPGIKTARLLLARYELPQRDEHG